MMQQRSAFYLGAVGVVGIPAGYWFWDVTGAAVVAVALGIGIVCGVLTRGAPASAQPAAKHAPLAATGVQFEPTARAKVHTSFVPVRMERAAAALTVPADSRVLPARDTHERSLRLTGDILRGMQTGGKTQRGVCSQCNATIWLSAQRPVKARCPVCGFSRVLS
ncbi:MAG: hypothetical protein LC624_01305 [Halobacteriales archaeon]|nr:hypothetical protein [Halobacteriales archaeon]